MPYSCRFSRGARSAAFIATVVASLVTAGQAEAQKDTSSSSDSTRRKVSAAAPRKAWYDRLSLRGYAQVRYNGLFQSNPKLQCPQCDKSIGANGGLSLRRARLVVSGDVSDRVYVYIQPDFATDVAGALHFAQVRDAYFDLALDRKKEFRLRFGQSKIPYGWENLQSSSNRLPFDRSDALNSALATERDIGVIFYWAPSKIRERFRTLVDSGLKGSGDYGVVGLGAYNGQGANRPEANQSMHSVLRVTYPFQLPNGQYIEAGIQGYTGRYVLPTRTAGLDAPSEFNDSRMAFSFTLYPQPFGLQAEWNFGKGPEVDPIARQTRERSLSGGYVQSMYRFRTNGQVFIPYARAQTYDGGKKFETDARTYRVREFEGGLEWTPFPSFELTAAYTVSNRTYEDAANPNNHQKGQFGRLQAQFNY